jgi:hypothetical protein
VDEKSIIVSSLNGVVAEQVDKPEGWLSGSGWRKEEAENP